MADRFSSHEEIEWDKKAFNAGHGARMGGKTRDSVPAYADALKDRAWKAGWADADASMMAERE
jgi:ribosome modulation factor